MTGLGHVRHVVRVGAAAVFVCGVLVLTAAPASAHANLLSSDPSPGAVLTAAPKQVKLSFSENVRAAPGAVRVFDADANRVDSGGIKTRNNRVTLPLPKLKDGAFVVVWRVTSADAHPAQGAFTFQIGAAAKAPNLTKLTNKLLAEDSGDRVVGSFYGIARGGVFVGTGLLIGGAAFGLLVWPRARSIRRTAQLVWSGWAMTLVATVVGLFVYGPYISGRGLGEVTDLDLLGDTIDLRFGKVWLIRLGLLVLAIPILRKVVGAGATASDRASRVALFAAVPLAVLLAATPGQAGHAIAGDWVTAAVISDTAHVLAGALWFGGLVILLTVLMPQRRAAELEEALGRWSRFAFACVTAIVVTGVFQSYRQVRSFDALRQTEFGRMLIVKVIIVLAALVAAAFSRDAVLTLYPRLRRARHVPVVAGGADDDRKPTKVEREAAEHARLRQLRVSVLVEVVAIALVLAATALLVNSPPAISSV